MTHKNFIKAFICAQMLITSIHTYTMEDALGNQTDDYEYLEEDISNDFLVVNPNLRHAITSYIELYSNNDSLETIKIGLETHANNNVYFKKIITIIDEFFKPDQLWSREFLRDITTVNYTKAEISLNSIFNQIEKIKSTATCLIIKSLMLKILFSALEKSGLRNFEDKSHYHNSFSIILALPILIYLRLLFINPNLVNNVTISSTLLVITIVATLYGIKTISTMYGNRVKQKEINSFRRLKETLRQKLKNIESELFNLGIQ